MIKREHSLDEVPLAIMQQIRDTLQALGRGDYAAVFRSSPNDPDDLEAAEELRETLDDYLGDATLLPDRWYHSSAIEYGDGTWHIWIYLGADFGDGPEESDIVATFDVSWVDEYLRAEVRRIGLR